MSRFIDTAWFLYLCIMLGTTLASMCITERVTYFDLFALVIYFICELVVILHWSFDHDV